MASVVFSQDTLRHFDPKVHLPVADVFPGTVGYHTGHNNYADEEFAEKYNISGSGDLLGMVAIHLGVAGTSSLNASYKVYQVATNGLPGAQLANRNIAYNLIPIDGNPFTVMFPSPVPVENEFFVSFNLGDYIHGNPGTKRIALSHSPDGTRSTTDLEVFGRNAIRWHSHGATVWKDYRTENFENYQPEVHFSIFPIIELDATSTIELIGGSSIAAVFPNPSSEGSFTIPIRSSAGGEAIFRLFDLTGKGISTTKTDLSKGENNCPFRTKGLSSGIYILLIQIPEGSVSQKIIIE